MSQHLLTEEDSFEEMSEDSSESIDTPSEEESEDSEEENYRKTKAKRKGKAKMIVKAKRETNSRAKDFTSGPRCAKKGRQRQLQSDNSKTIDTLSNTQSVGSKKEDHHNCKCKCERKANDSAKGTQKMDKIEARSVIRYLNIKGLNAREIHKSMRAVYHDAAPSYDTVVRWRRSFNAGSRVLSDKPRSGRPSLADNAAIVNEVEKYLQEDNRITLHAIMDKTKLGYGTVWKIIHDELKMCKDGERWVPCADTPEKERKA